VLDLLADYLLTCVLHINYNFLLLRCNKACLPGKVVLAIFVRNSFSGSAALGFQNSPEDTIFGNTDTAAVAVVVTLLLKRVPNSVSPRLLLPGQKGCVGGPPA
jgi:hypothetical protein